MPVIVGVRLAARRHLEAMLGQLGRACLDLDRDEARRLVRRQWRRVVTDHDWPEMVEVCVVLRVREEGSLAVSDPLAYRSPALDEARARVGEEAQVLVGPLTLAELREELNEGEPRGRGARRRAGSGGAQSRAGRSRAKCP